MKKQVHNELAEISPEMAERFNSQYNGNDDIPSLNSYLRQVLIKAPISTMDERGCLIDDLEKTIWLDYLKTHVIPTIVRFDLI